MAEQGDPNVRKFISEHPAPPPGPPSTPMHVTFTRRDDGYVEVEWRVGITHRQRAYLSPDNADELSTFLDKGVWLSSLPDRVLPAGELVEVVDLDG